MMDYKLPSLIIPGAPKCGTTSLHRYLSEHPRIFFPEIKEPNFFAKDIWKSNHLTWKNYISLYEGQKRGAIAGDASTGYLFSEDAIPLIESTLDRPQYIVCVRNPVDLASSYHAELLFQGIENVSDFESAWRMQDRRRSGLSKLPFNCPSYKLLMYRDVASVGSHLRRLSQHVEKARILVVFLEELALDPKTEYLRILYFLGLEDDGRNFFPTVNPYGARRWPIAHRLIRPLVSMKNALGLGYMARLNAVYDGLNSKKRPKPTLSENFLLELRQVFESEVDELSMFTGKDAYKIFSID